MAALAGTEILQVTPLRGDGTPGPLLLQTTTQAIADLASGGGGESQAAGLFLASPVGAPGVPSFRTITTTDLPAPYVNLRPPAVTDDTAHAYAIGDWWNGTTGLYQSLRVTPTGQAVWAPSAPASTPLPLDAVPTALAAYGMSRLTHTYTGYCIDVLRASDSTTISVGFVGNSLDTATLDAFLVGTTGVVTRWCDQSGNGNHATAAAATAPAVNSALMIGNARSLIFNSVWNGTTTSVFMTIPAGVAAAFNNSSVVMVGRVRDTTYQMPVLQLTAASGTTLSLGHSTGSLRFGVQTSNEGFFGPTNGFSSQTPFVAGYASGASAFEIWVDNSLASGGASGTTSALAGGFIGQAPAINANTGYCELAQIIIYATGLSDAQRQTATAAAYQSFGLTPQSRSIWVADGDSITDGYRSTYHQNYPRRAEAFLKKPTIIRNFGNYGDTLTGRLAAYNSTSTAAGSFIPNGADNILSIFAGTNDIQNNSPTAASLFTTLQHYCAAARATGFKVIVATILPRTSFSTAQEAIRQAYNTLVESSWSTFADGLADTNADPTMGGAQSVAYNTALYADGTHPTPLGYSYLAPIFAAAVNRLLA